MFFFLQELFIQARLIYVIQLPKDVWVENLGRNDEPEGEEQHQIWIQGAVSLQHELFCCERCTEQQARKGLSFILCILYTCNSYVAYIPFWYEL